VIATPGHTPGHVCVFDPVGSLLILGDALTNIGHKVSLPQSQYTADMAQAQQSAKRLAQLRFERAVFGHGEPIGRNASQAVVDLADSL
jgi:glyoxylase-like metal-dependent hydrolase (beta-lactamase superfamily II)